MPPDPKPNICGDRLLAMLLDRNRKYLCSGCNEFSCNEVCRRCNRLYNGVLAIQTVNWTCWACGRITAAVVMYGADHLIEHRVGLYRCLWVDCRYPRDAACQLQNRYYVAKLTRMSDEERGLGVMRKERTE
ncbi:hypothetical protein EX30DRAFT_180011 [Ascodesmis nigricans]|uniref:Uncharacterized protein n=1 Tax=Ascodesmis nigricans TaxID=341454 RepID=A0A4S2MQN8_9PEZI|nr:hypothetical protein EX30DRAFT_180011 [Ascodesmis nigricans]